MKYLKTTAVLLGAALLTACADPSAESAQESAEQKMNYVKTSVLYDTLIDMYANPDNYLGKQYHMVGMLYPSTSDGESFYSIYAEPSGSDEGIGLELDWDDFSSFLDYDTITVEGTLDKEKTKHDGNEIEYLVLRVSMIEKRQSK